MIINADILCLIKSVTMEPTASGVFCNRMLSMVNSEDVNAIIQAQRHMWVSHIVTCLGSITLLLCFRADFAACIHVFQAGPVWEDQWDADQLQRVVQCALTTDEWTLSNAHPYFNRDEERPGQHFQTNKVLYSQLKTLIMTRWET